MGDRAPNLTPPLLDATEFAELSIATTIRFITQSHNALQLHVLDLRRRSKCLLNTR